ESEGAATITVTISHDATTPQIVTDTANVSDPNVLATGGFTIFGAPGCDTAGRFPGVPGSNQTVATFTDPGNPTGTAEGASDYSATIDWGDGSTVDTGTITRSGGTWTVTGHHTYTGMGSFTKTITVTISHDATTPQAVSDTAQISDTLNYPADAMGAPVVPNATTTVDFTALTISSTAAPTVSLCGIKTLNVTTSGPNSLLMVLGTAGDDTFTYTPTGATSGALTVSSTPPISTMPPVNLVTVNFTGVGGTFTLDPAGGSDTVAVDDTSG